MEKQKGKNLEITDEELMQALAEDESSDYEDRVELDYGEEYVEVDGVKIIPFSPKQDLEMTKFDEKGNIIVSSSTSSEYSDLFSENEEEEEDFKTPEKGLELIRQLIDLVSNVDKENPCQTVNEALAKCDGETLTEITNIATELLFMGRGNIYIEKMKVLQKEIE